jgi:hypothetical protein
MGGSIVTVCRHCSASPHARLPKAAPSKPSVASIVAGPGGRFLKTGIWRAKLSESPGPRRIGWEQAVSVVLPCMTTKRQTPSDSLRIRMDTPSTTHDLTSCFVMLRTTKGIMGFDPGNIIEIEPKSSRRNGQSGDAFMTSSPGTTNILGEFVPAGGAVAQRDTRIAQTRVVRCRIAMMVSRCKLTSVKKRPAGRRGIGVDRRTVTQPDACIDPTDHRKRLRALKRRQRTLSGNRSILKRRIGDLMHHPHRQPNGVE